MEIADVDSANERIGLLNFESINSTRDKIQNTTRMRTRLKWYYYSPNHFATFHQSEIQ